MNKERRKELKNITSRLDALRTQLERIKGDLECVNDEEQEAYDNMGDGLQNTIKGITSEDAIGNMECVKLFL